jgi:tetratricopeptide (TPR) repeat protein
MSTTSQNEGTLMDELHWTRLTDLFEKLLETADTDSVLASEPDPDIRSAAFALWQHHVSAAREDYLGEPMDFQVAPSLQPGQRLVNRFRVEKMLGSGGMGEVYLAWDERMEDRVALKTIARLLAHSAWIRGRFVAEVQNARRITHPNICRIHELFEDGETAFFSMEFIDGVLLSDSLNKAFVVAHAPAILRQMAVGLQTAHEQGVVHGDFKPANVMIVPRAGTAKEPPRAVIMDFGLARGLDRVVATSQEGFSLRGGSADYMAPELSEGAPATVSSDIFAFGKVAAELMPRERFWAECTRPLPQDRPVSMAEIVRWLQPGTSRRYWVLGLGAVAAAGAARYGFRDADATHFSLPAEARVLVNGFRPVSENVKDHARVVRSLVVTALQQSPRVHAIADEDVLPTLRRLSPAAGPPVGGRVLTELLSKVRAAFWIDGDLRQNGGRFSLDLQVFAATGQVVAASAFHDQSSLVALARVAALWVRQTAGESQQSLAANAADVGTYTSEVPEALQEYYKGSDEYNNGNMDQALPMFQEAVRLDPNFAQAHNMLALTINAARPYDEGFTEIEAAMNLAKRLPEKERIAIETNFYRMTEDVRNMIDSANRSLDLHRDEPRCYAVLGRALMEAGRPQESIEWFRRAVDLAPDDWMMVLALMDGQVAAGQFTQALDEIRTSSSGGLQNPWLYSDAGAACMGLERYEDAIQCFGKIPMDTEKSRRIINVKILQGYLDVAAAAMEELRASARNPLEAHPSNEFLCGLYYVTGRPGLAIKKLAEMADLPALPTSARLLACTSSWARRLGDEKTLGRARDLSSEIASRWPNTHMRAFEKHSKALALWQGNSFDEAEQNLLESTGAAYHALTLFDLAEFFTQRAKWQEASSYWEKFEARRGEVIMSGWFPGILVLGWLYRAATAQALGDRATAFEYSRKVLQHWSRFNPGASVVTTAERIRAVSRPI